MQTQHRWGADVVRHVVDGAGVVLLLTGAVVGVGTLIQHAGAWTALVCLVALGAAGQLTAAALGARYDGWRDDDVAASGGWITAAALVASLLATDPALCGRLVSALALLGLLTLRLTGAGQSVPSEDQHAR